MPFEDRLLSELRHVVAANPSPEPVAAPARPSRLTRPRIALGAGGVAAVSAGVALLAGGGGVSPAYAVTPQSDGDVTVHIASMRDADGLQQSLREAGVPADVTYVANAVPICTPTTGPAAGVSSSAVTRAPGDAGPTVQSGSDDSGPTFSTGGAAGSTAGSGPVTKAAPAGAPPLGPMTIDTNGDGATFTVDPKTIPAGKKLVITTTDGTMKAISMGVIDADGKAPACVPGPPPGQAGPPKLVQAKP